LAREAEEVDECECRGAMSRKVSEGEGCDI